MEAGLEQWSTIGLCDDCETECTSHPPPPLPPPPSGEGTGGKGSVSGDPHFLDTQGTRYDFNGFLGKDYCLFTDASVHIIPKFKWAKTGWEFPKGSLEFHGSVIPLTI